MNIVEALKEVGDGNVVTRKGWFHNIVVMLSSESEKIIVYNTTANTEQDYAFTAADVQADDWVIKRYNRPLTFIEAFKEIKNGNKVKRKVWEDGCYVDGNSRFHSLVLSDLLANDWEVVE